MVRGDGLRNNKLASLEQAHSSKWVFSCKKIVQQFLVGKYLQKLGGDFSSVRTAHMGATR